MRLIALALLLAGCNDQECDRAKGEIDTAVVLPQACDADSDCVVESLNCGLAGCFAVLSTTTLAKISSALATYSDHCEDNSDCVPCTSGPQSVTCSAGLCKGQ